MNTYIRPPKEGLLTQPMAFILALTREGMLYLLAFFIIAHSSSPCSTTTNPLVSYGQHFGSTIHALANVKVLVTNSILHLGELVEELEEIFTIEWVWKSLGKKTISHDWFHFRQRREHHVFQQLLQMVPGLEEHIMSGNDGQIMEVAEHVCQVHRNSCFIVLIPFSFRKVCQVLKPTIPRT